MGMAASQARYLELTARKTNVEFEGQQVNQQRTELANQSAGLFAQLMGLQVPTAPSSADYTTTNYTFNDGANKCTITGIRSIAEGVYNAEVSYYYTESIYTGVAKTRTDLGVQNTGTIANPIYHITSGKPGDLQHLLERCTADDIPTRSSAIKQICINNPDSEFADNVGYDPDTGEIGDITQAYYFKLGNVDYYYCATDLSNASGQGGSAVSLTGYYAANIDKKRPVIEKAYVTKSDSGRYSKIQLQSEWQQELDLTAENVTDQNAYKDAMNEYEYQQMRYQQEVNNINANTSIIQAHDRTLELKLKQLDTEQEALSTELDSVKKVIDKNIEQTFKTFQ